MSRTFLIFRHEFLHTIKRAGFILMTLSLPVLALLFIGISKLATGTPTAVMPAMTVGYVDELGGFGRFTTQENYTFVRFDTEAAAKHALIKNEVSEYFVIPSDLISTGIMSLYSSQTQIAVPGSLTAAVNDFIDHNLLAGKVGENVIIRVESGSGLVPVTLTSTGAAPPPQGGSERLIVPIVFGLLFALALVFTNVYLVQSLSGEKENRLMEILLSSVSTRQLLAGKVLGLGAAGLLQVVVWVIAIPILEQFASGSVEGLLSLLALPAAYLIFAVIYFVLGYLLYAVLSASIAAISSNVQDARGLSSIWAIVAIAPIAFTSLLVLHPNSPAWIAFSIFPFTAPQLVLLRLGITGIPAWQVAVSMAVMVLSITLGLLLAARLLKLYSLMYGKRPSLGEIAQSLSSA